MTAEEGGAEASVPVNVLLPWLGWIDRDEVARLLTGCELDDGDSNEFLPIESYDGVAATVTLVGGRRLSLRRVSNGAIVDRRPGWPLLAAIEGAKTPLERREAQVQKQLRLRRVDPNSLRSAEDREQVLGFLELVEKGELPAEPALRAFTEAMKPAASAAKHRRAAQALRAVMAMCARHGDTPPSLPWRLAWFLNQSGQFDEVVALCEAPQARAMQGMHRAYLATIRASALLALANIGHDGRLLDQAEAALKIAYAIDGGSDEVKAVYRELTRMRRREVGGPS